MGRERDSQSRSGTRRRSTTGAVGEWTVRGRTATISASGAVAVRSALPRAHAGARANRSRTSCSRANRPDASVNGRDTYRHPVGIGTVLTVTSRRDVTAGGTVLEREAKASSVTYAGGATTSRASRTGRAAVSRGAILRAVIGSEGGTTTATAGSSPLPNRGPQFSEPALKRNPRSEGGRRVHTRHGYTSRTRSRPHRSPRPPCPCSNGVRPSIRVVRTVGSRLLGSRVRSCPA
jgi:hypothetical protein